MYNLTDIQLKTLRDYLSDYKHFTSLSEDAKQEYLKKILIMDSKKQEELYSWLKYQEEIEKGKILAKFKAQVGLLGNKVKMMVNKKNEYQSQYQDKQTETLLTNSLN
jgi:hypothetical protein